MNHIKIDLERIVSDIDRNIFGGYMELGIRDTGFKHLDVFDPDGKDKGGLTGDVRAVIERMKLSNIRFGGNFFSGYRWRDGVGPRPEKKAQHRTGMEQHYPKQFRH